MHLKISIISKIVGLLNVDLLNFSRVSKVSKVLSKVQS